MPEIETSDTVTGRDVHSFSKPEQVRVQHVALDVDVSFDQRVLSGSATLDFERVSPAADILVLDTRDLDIHKVEARAGNGTFAETAFGLGEKDPILGTPLTISLPEAADGVRVFYTTGPEASALQWLEPEQTAGKKQPFLYTQSQAIHARSWIPLQDSPGVRVTYEATVHTPRELRAVMSAEMRTSDSTEYHFTMPQAIPPYLIALAVGDLVFEAMSERTGVWAEPSVVKRAAWEFEDTESMMRAVEGLYGPYRWGRYDLLVLPPSFPFGGMENPQLTFATPTILAGDKSLVSLVAHELAHSWSGNLVSNATWSDFWLNEGFTVYLENRIQELVFGSERAEMELALEVGELEKELERLEPREQVLHIDLEGRDPDAGLTLVPYIKGMLFLKTLEEAAGRERFDRFLRRYFDHFAFQSITTADFQEYLAENLPAARSVPVEKWLYEPGLPDGFPRPHSEAFTKIEAQAQEWLRDKRAASSLSTKGWTTQHWLHFLRALPEEVEEGRLRELDRTFELSAAGNAEILSQWLVMAVRNGYEPAYPALEEFLTAVGRRKFLKPLYEELVKTPQGKKRAELIFEKARSAYHPIARASVEEILRSKGS